MKSTIALVSLDRGFANRFQPVFAKQGWSLRSIDPSEFRPSLFDEDRPNAVLVDMNGAGQIDAIQSMRCREHLRRIPIIALMDTTSKDLVVMAHRAGVRDILVKQSNDQQIVDRISKYCPLEAEITGETHSHPGEKEESGLQWGDPASTAFKKHIQREVHKRLEMLPSLPNVVMEIMKLVEDDKSSARDFEEHISHDPALAARILRIANSSFFAQSRKIKSIRDAIVVLGYRTLKSVVMAASTGAILNRPAEGYGLISGGLWKHSIACAMGSRLLASRLGRGEAAAEEFFVQGLLHDIGKILLNTFLNEKSSLFQETFSREKPNLLEAEMVVMGTDHCKVGMKIAEQWNLPMEVRYAIQYHHNPRLADRFQEEVTLIHSVNYLCYELRIGLRPDSQVRVPFDARTAGKIGIDECLLHDIENEFLAQLKELEKLFVMIGAE
jgi:putative nucleotidyltransferase with HDIG domain